VATPCCVASTITYPDDLATYSFYPFTYHSDNELPPDRRAHKRATATIACSLSVEARLRRTQWRRGRQFKRRRGWGPSAVAPAAATPCSTAATSTAIVTTSTTTIHITSTVTALPNTA